MRKFILAVALLLGILFVLTRFAEVQNIAGTLQRGELRYLLMAAILQMAWLIVVGSSYHFIYRSLGMVEKPIHLVRLAAASSFVNIVAPSGGASGIAVFIADARQRGKSAARVMVAGTLYLFFDYVGFLCILTLGMVVLARRNTLNWAEITASILLLAGALGLMGLLYLAMQSAGALGKVLAWGARVINRILHPFLHRDYLAIERAFTFAKDAADGIKTLQKSPGDIFWPFFLAILNKCLLLGVLWLVFMAFQVPYSVGTIVAGFSIGYLFLIVSPTPSGIGVVEGILTLTLSSLYVALADATVVVIAYRAITFWFPLLVGMASFRNLGKLNQVNNIKIN